MTVIVSEIGFYKAKEMSSASTNGGRISNEVMQSGSPNNLWPNVLKAERDNGSELLRKFFIKVNNENGDLLVASRVWNDLPTPADDYMYLFLGTQRNIQADITGSERKYGVGTLNTAITGGVGSTILVNVENTLLTGIFQDGDTIRITNKTNADDATGDEEYFTISGSPSVNGTVVTITVDGTIQNSYLTSNTKIQSIIEFGTVQTSFSNWVKTSASGTFDDTNYPPILNNLGCVEETFTITFTDATSFNVVGDSLGSLPSGNRNTDYEPNNSDVNEPYFKLESAGFGGTWQAGDTIVFQTHPAAIPIWIKRIVPAGSGSLSGNKNITVLTGESA